MSVWREQYKALCDQVKDYRVYQKQDVAAVLLFGFHMPDLLANYGYEYRGHNVSNRGWSYLLVVKATFEGTPLVAFINERTPTACMVIFIRQFDEGRVKWCEDKYA